MRTAAAATIKLSTHLVSLVPFSSPSKHWKIYGFLVFTGGIERDQLQETG